MTEPQIFPLHLADVRIPEGHPLAGGSLAIVAHAVAHRDGVFLFDTGVGTGNAEVEEYFDPRRRPLPDALGAHGISMADVTAVGNCHLHFDHGGQNALFRAVPIFAQAREWAMVHEPDYTVPEWVDFPGARYELVEGETEIAPGLRLVPTPGHSPGHQSLVVDAPGGPLVIAGQAVFTLAEWEGATDPASSGRHSAPDEEAYVASVRRLRELEPRRVHLVHDTAIWERR
jgi:N-acyl homoserine lactone hydrolase